MASQPGDRPRFCRILMIEDDEVRIQRVTDWLPTDLRLVVARSAGRAIATLRLDGPQTYAGIMLDHDLQQQIAAAAEAVLSGSDVVRVLIERIDHDVPVLVHSMNASRASSMVSRLKAVGFDVSCVPFESLAQAHFLAWIEHVRDLWDEA